MVAARVATWRLLRDDLRIPARCALHRMRRFDGNTVDAIAMYVCFEFLCDEWWMSGTLIIICYVVNAATIGHVEMNYSFMIIEEIQEFLREMNKSSDLIMY